MPFILKPKAPSYFTYQYGTSGNEYLFGSDAANDWIDGGAGHDGIFGYGGHDVLHGGAGNDTVLGGAGNDSLYGDDGDDLLMGGTGSNLLDGGAGDDTLVVDVGSGGTLLGGAGLDFISFTEFNGVSFCLAGDPYWGISWSGIENVRGSNGHDMLSGDDGDNRIEGLGGNDTIHGSAGNDVLYGGRWTGASGSGDDWIDGGDGDDLMIGGDGADTFAFASLASGNDSIADFTSGVDVIALSSENFGIASLDDVDFLSGSGVQAADRAALLYDTDTGMLSYDTDGLGGADAVVFATLAGVPELSQHDFILV
jgi:serralysin